MNVSVTEKQAGSGNIFQDKEEFPFVRTVATVRVLRSKYGHFGKRISLRIFFVIVALNKIRRPF